MENVCGSACETAWVNWGDSVDGAVCGPTCRIGVARISVGESAWVNWVDSVDGAVCGPTCRIGVARNSVDELGGQCGWVA